MSLLDEIVGSVVSEAIALVGPRLALAVGGLARPSKQDFDLIRWFNTYELTASGPELPLDPSGAEEEEVAEVLCSPTVQAIVHELLALRLTDAPETEVERLRDAFRRSVLGLRLELPEAIFDAFDYHICSMVGRLSADRSGVFDRIRQEAFSSRIAATLSAIERHTVAISDGPDLASIRAFRSRYQRQVLEHYGKLEPPDFQRRRRVPIDDLYVPSQIVSMPAEPTRNPVATDIRRLDGEIDRTVLLGDPGVGKTTACHVVMHRHALDGRLPVPFLVTLREFAAENPPERSVVGFIEHRLETIYQCPPHKGLVERLLIDGAAVVIFDGLDELVDTTRRAEVAGIVELFSQSFPFAPILVTSRLVGYDQARLDPREFVVYRVSDFDDDRVERYVRLWFAQEDGVTREEATRLAEAFMAESEEVSDLRANPLMLALMCILYRGERSIPQNRPELYAECARLLFSKWDARRKIHVQLRARHLVEPALRHLAYWMLTRAEGQSATSRSELVTETAKFLRGRRFEDPDEAREAAQEFIDFCHDRAWVFSDMGTTARGEELYGFTHRTFMEYFAASHLASDCDSPEELAKRLAPRVARQEWDVVGQLAVQTKDATANRGADRVFAALLNERRRRGAEGRGNVLGFLARCLAFLDPLPSLVRSLTDRVLDQALTDLTSRTAVIPLSQLTASADRSRDAVADQLSERIGSLMRSQLEADRLAGLQLILAIPAPLTVSANLRIETDVMLFWDRWSTALSKRFKAAFTEHIGASAGVAVGAWHQGAADRSQIVTKHGNLDFFFSTPSIGIMNVHWFCIAELCLRQIVYAETIPHDDIRRDLQIIARYISWNTDHYARGAVSILPRDPVAFFLSGPYDKMVTDKTAFDSLSPGDRGTVFFLLATLAETAPQDAIASLVRPDRLGLLHDFHMHISCRHGIEIEDHLPRLPIREHQQGLLDSWARREIKLVREE